MELTLKEAIEKAEIMIEAGIIGGGLELCVNVLIDHAKKIIEPEGKALIGKKVKTLEGDIGKVIKYSSTNKDYLIETPLGRRLWCSLNYIELIDSE